MYTNKYQFKIPKFIAIGLLVFIGIYLYLFGIWEKPCFAQTLGLSISPPISEIVIVPGKEITQSFTITNDGNDGMASIYLIPFRSQGENGSVSLDESNIVDSDSPFASWFNLLSPVANFGEKFYMAGGTSKPISIMFSPPTDAPQKDYYFTLVFELNNEIPQGSLTTGSENRARIGSNVLISVSDKENPSKNIRIVEFTAPKIIDSLFPLNYKIRIGNYGSYVFKSDGKITIKSFIGKTETLSLAPLNVISDSVRNISCLSEEELTPCKTEKKVLFGIYKSTLEVSANQDESSQEKTITTVAFPFSIVLALSAVFITYRIVLKKHAHEST